MNALDELLSGGSKGAFNKDSVIGETVTGTIVSAVERQRTDYVTKALQTWDDGSPQMHVVITIHTDLRDPADPHDEGTRSVYIKTWGLDKQAFITAIRQAGFTKASEALAPGNIFTASYTGRQPSKHGDDQKIYQYSIQRGNPSGAGLDQALATAPPAQVQAQPQQAYQTPSQPVAQPQVPNPWDQGPAQPAQVPVQQQYAAPAPAQPVYQAPAQQPPTPAQQAPAPVQQAPADPAGMIRAGWTDEQIQQATGATPQVVALMRQQVGA